MADGCQHNQAQLMGNSLNEDEIMRNEHRKSAAFLANYKMVDTPEAVLTTAMMDDMAEALLVDSMIGTDDADWVAQDPSYLYEMSVSY